MARPKKKSAVSKLPGSRKKQLIIIGIIIAGVLLLAFPGGKLLNSGAVPSRNPFTVGCPGNRVLYSVPKGPTATASARQRVFGSPYPNANVESTTFMGHSIYINRKITSCLKAVEWDIRYKYKSNYRVNAVYGASTLSSQNPDNYFHAYGGAIDINPAQNPQCKGGCAHDMPSQWVRAFRAHGFFWGGNFRTDKDYMHFEWHGQK